MPSTLKSLAGQLLIASPKMFDPNFFRTVVLMLRHTEEGALGVVLNRPLETTIKQAWEQVSEIPCQVDAPLYSGGPCEGPLVVLHAGDAADDDEPLQVLPGLRITTDRDDIESLVTAVSDNEQQSPPIKFFVGYAGWSAGQLEGELAADDGWLVAPATPELIFADPEDLWAATLKQIARNKPLPGVNPKCIPPDPSMN